MHKNATELANGTRRLGKHEIYARARHVTFRAFEQSLKIDLERRCSRVRPPGTDNPRCTVGGRQPPIARKKAYEEQSKLRSEYLRRAGLKNPHSRRWCRLATVIDFAKAVSCHFANAVKPLEASLRTNCTFNPMVTALPAKTLTKMQRNAFGCD